MLLKAFTLLSLGICVFGHTVVNDPNVPNFIPVRPTEPHWKASEEYLKKRLHNIVHRDHGCVKLEHVDNHKGFQCVNIWLKNQFSESQVAPTSVFLDYQHPNEHKEYAYKPTVTWVENINPWRVRGCVAAPGGKDNTLAHGKLKWFAVYNMPQTNQQQHGRLDANTAFTGNKNCKTFNFPTAFSAIPHVKFQIKSKYGHMSGENALIAWGKALSASQATVCVEEFFGWSGYHHDYEIHWFAVVNPDNQDDFSQKLTVNFKAGDQYPSDHHRLNYFYCKNVTLSRWHYPCPSVMVQAFEHNTAVCNSALVAWVSYMKDDQMTVCYADKRGIMGQRKVDVAAHVIIYGAQDGCQNIQCPQHQECTNPTWNTAKCGCITHCHDEEKKVCGTNMQTYKNRCELEKAICESGNKFEYAHHGECEKHTVGHGKAQLAAVAGKDCDGLYCAVISTGHRIWYQHAKINVQISVNWNSAIHGNDKEGMMTHDATASWVEEVTPNSFKACIMEAGRYTKSMAPHINWFAYQGELEKVSTETIEVGDWESGTHCVPLHVRKEMSKPMPNLPPSCPRHELDDEKKMSAEEQKYRHDSDVMAKIYGNEQQEWLKRMLSGHSVKKVKLTSGMKLGGGSIMLTVEQGKKDATVASHDAVNVWMEHDMATEETYVCLREMQNWDGTHQGIHVHWTLFMDKDQKKEDIFEEKKSDQMKPTEGTKPEVMKHMFGNDHGFMQKLHFKPSMEAPEDSNYAFCETKAFLPEGFSHAHDSTVLVSLSHHIPPHAAFESMKKFHMHQLEVSKGMPMGDMSFNDETEQPSWMMPHMWRNKLSGWRPHMRIAKNADYSAWVEGMNKTHIRVCQKSVFTGIYEGVGVNMVILPQKCPAGYTGFRGECYQHVSKCENFDTALSVCRSAGANMVAAEDARENVFVSYIATASSADIHIGKSDRAVEGVWKREDPNDNSTYSRWAVGQPATGAADDCAYQTSVAGRLTHDFGEFASACSTCREFVCAKPKPQLSCHFPHDFCKKDEKCTFEPMMGPKCEKKT